MECLSFRINAWHCLVKWDAGLKVREYGKYSLDASTNHVPVRKRSEDTSMEIKLQFNVSLFHHIHQKKILLFIEPAKQLELVNWIP